MQVVSKTAKLSQQGPRNIRVSFFRYKIKVHYADWSKNVSSGFGRAMCGRLIVSVPIAEVKFSTEYRYDYHRLKLLWYTYTNWKVAQPINIKKAFQLSVFLSDKENLLLGRPKKGLRAFLDRRLGGGNIYTTKR